MKAFLLFLSKLVLLIFPVCLYAQDIDLEAAGERLQDYSFQLETQKGYISGMLLTTDTGKEIRGSMINEFGVSAIDFVYNKEKQKVKLVNIVDFLNKWYIKMVLKNDLKFCLHILYGTPYKSKHKYELIRTVESVSIFNNKRKLKYTFSPINHLRNADDTQE